jgi:teichoic acid transport system ATP-binding protein
MTRRIAISSVDICKRYKLYQRPSDRLKEALTPFRKPLYKEFLALDNVSISVAKGETVGIIGRNGSGKSTLLQVLSGVTKPSSGKVTINGRVSALLELGAGFNPEFTGKQNAYINAAILGLGKSEIDAIYPGIVDFAAIGHFIDQPVKLYSSGMYVRLAFAVAISVNPEILIVDEALAVGDTLFQSKCFAKFREFQEKGCTILFVTHALDMITSVCSSAYLLEKGSVVVKGDPKKVVDVYNRILANESEDTPKPVDSIAEIDEPADISRDQGWKKEFQARHEESRYGNGKAEIVDAGIFSLAGRPEKVLTKGEYYEFRLKIRFHKPVKAPIYAYAIRDVKGFNIAGSNTLFQKVNTESAQAGDAYVVTFKQKMVLNQGGYLLSFGCTGFEDGNFVVYERRYDYMAFEVISEKAGVGFLDMDPEIGIVKIESD